MKFADLGGHAVYKINALCESIILPVFVTMFRGGIRNPMPNTVKNISRNN